LCSCSRLRVKYSHFFLLSCTNFISVFSC
jgi:hypothetical protein